MNTDSIDKLMTIAYYIGREEGVKKICDKASKIFADQQAKVKACRYSNMASKVQGDIGTIYDGDYSGGMSDFGSDETNL